jgi:hypothetical protein
MEGVMLVTSHIVAPGFWACGGLGGGCFADIRFLFILAIWRSIADSYES